MGSVLQVLHTSREEGEEDPFSHPKEMTITVVSKLKLSKEKLFLKEKNP